MIRQLQSYGISKEIIRQGTGNLIKSKDKVKVHFILTVLKNPEYGLEQNVIVESTRETDEPIKYIVGCEFFLFQSFDTCVLTMTEGEFSRFTFENPTHAFGSSGREPDIPPNSKIILEIEILQVMKIFISSLQAISDSKRLNDEAAAKFRERKLAEAITLYTEALRSLEDYFGETIILERVRTQRNLALMYSKSYDWKNCLFYANEVLKVDPKDLKALMRKIEGCLGTGEKEMAKETYEYAKQISNNHAAFNVFAHAFS